MYHGASRRITAAGAALLTLFSRGPPTLELAVLVGQSVGLLVGPSCHVFESRAVLALLPLPNRPRLGCRKTGLVLIGSGPIILPKWPKK